MTANLVRTASKPLVVAVAHLMHRHAPRDVIREAIGEYCRLTGEDREAVHDEAWAYAMTLRTPTRSLAGAAVKGTCP